MLDVGEANVVMFGAGTFMGTRLDTQRRVLVRAGFVRGMLAIRYGCICRMLFRGVIGLGRGMLGVVCRPSVALLMLVRTIFRAGGGSVVRALGFELDRARFGVIRCVTLVGTLLQAVRDGLVMAVDDHGCVVMLAGGIITFHGVVVPAIGGFVAFIRSRPARSSLVLRVAFVAIPAVVPVGIAR